ncbi:MULTISPECIES: PAQR family membrane homeostasis protein TrhA [Aeromonas]|uniref:PAQR family membrane homeostasis protein TrhA n=1 Tax=Aeromonas TaxID=642 RepID=UPI000CDC1BA0|nr:MULTISPECIES: hemolysin III family protein [Aeromonas]AUY10646.1 hemolysin III family protein [Aeromonas sp. ASNIH2]AUZ80219.1 hemolysin III family protein [Aeromonas sp. ASNIH1]MCX4038495.1 hemolysin III family protein [Aeromonas caviae]MDX7770139.1 hemolysin III family protein [Aeromonas caviae]MDX7849500.1 hemolysin III family protein [Aeromonas caviae]
MMDVTGYSPWEEWANRLSHGLGLLLGGLGLVLLLHKGWDQGPRVLLSYGVYGASLVLLYLASTLYHSVSSVTARRWSKLFDHCAIYLLIAGTYTPFLLVALDTPLAQGLMVVIWGLALAGVVFKLIFINRFKKVSLFTYLMLGWLSLVVIYQLYLHLDGTGLLLLGLGGLIYSLGVIFYVAKRIPYNHAIWHLFVLGGSLCHFMAIYGYI